jgi:RNA polymerase sigma factor (sigma-70 family)
MVGMHDVSTKFRANTAHRLLVEAAQRGERTAVEQLVRRYEPLVSRVVWKIRPPRGCEREDLAQEARIGLIAAIRAWRPERGPFPAFADRCVTNQALLAVELCARNKHQLLSQAISLEGEHAPPVGSGRDGLALRLLDTIAATGGGWDPESHFLVREQLDGVLRVLPTLTPKERHSLVGILSGETYEALGRARGCTPKAASLAADRARRKLAAGLEPAA